MGIVKKLFLVFGISLILLNFVSADILINEIMYNPEGDDNNKEYIEIYSDSFIDLIDYIIQDSSSQDPLEPLQYFNNSYSLIIEEGFDYDGINASIYSVGATIGGGGLLNSGEILIFKDNNSEILDVVHYYSNWGADGNGMSLCLMNNQFQECIPTPGFLNSNSLDYSNIKINEFLPDPTGYDDASMPNGEWIELYNSAGYSIDLEGLILNDDYGNGLEISDTNTLNSNTTINPNSYLTIYKNGDGTLALNNDGDTVKLFYENIILDQVSYSSSTEGLSWSKTNNFWIQTLPTPNQENNYEEPDYTSDLKIEQIYLGSDDKANFGDMLRVEVNIYKGDSTKSSVQLYAKNEDGEEISKRSKLNVYSTFTNYSLTIPVQLYPNCNGNFPEGDYIMYLTGLDETDETGFEVKEITTSLCETIITSSTSYKNYHVEFLEIPYEIFQTSLSKIKIVNNDSTSKDFEVWSYIYNGPKSYSGDREENKREVEIPWDSFINVDLENVIDSAIETGEYKLKIKVQKEDRATPDEFTFDVYVIGSEEGSLEEFPQFLSKGLNDLSEVTGNIIYSSSDMEAKELGIYFFCAVLIILIIYLIVVKFL